MSHKVTLSVSEELYKRMEQHGIRGPGKQDVVNWSKIFQDATEMFLEIDTRSKNINIPIETIRKVSEELIHETNILSFEFGKDIFLEWIYINGNIKYIIPMLQLKNTYVDLYGKLGNIIGPIEEYEKSFKQEYLVTLDRDIFAKGFISTAKTLADAVQNLIPTNKGENI